MLVVVAACRRRKTLKTTCRKTSCCQQGWPRSFWLRLDANRSSFVIFVTYATAGRPINKTLPCRMNVPAKQHLPTVLASASEHQMLQKHCSACGLHDPSRLSTM